MSVVLTGATLTARADAVAEVAARFADDVDRAGRFPAEAVAAMRAHRLLGASVPRELGGDGLTLGELGEVAQRLGGACSSAAMVFAMHHGQVLSIVRHLGGSAAFADLARRIADEQLLLASATTEIGIGGDVRSSSCFVDQVGDRIHLVKNAPVISYGEEADLVLVTARRTELSAPSDQVVLVADRAGVVLERTGTWDTLGLRGTCSYGYLLTADVEACRLAPEPYEKISTETMLPVSHVLWASVWLGMSRSAVDTARRFVRAAARKDIGKVPPTATALVGLVADLDTLDAVVEAAAAEFDRLADDRDALSRVDVAIRMNNLKVTASTSLADIVSRVLVLTGIAGFRNDGPYSVARLFRDAQGAAVMVHNDRITANNAQLILVAGASQKGSR